MRDVFIVAAVRTPIGRFGGSLRDHSPVDLAAHAMKGALERSTVDGSALDLYLFGNVLRAGHGQLIPRQAAIKAGIPAEIDGAAIDMVCSSGMMSLMTGSAYIKAGDADLVLVGGTESMSATGFYLSSRARWGYKFLLGSPENIVDLMLHDGLTDPMSDEAMGQQTERLAAEHGIGREELDEIAAESHRRAAAADFSEEIVPMELSIKGETVVFDSDEGVRPETSADKLAKLKPAFQRDGVLTAGNSSQISDGASALVIASGAAVEAHGLKPLARLTGSAWSAGESWRFPEAPIPAVKKVLEKTGNSISDFDLTENNEAFAINNILFHRMLDIPFEKMNVNGGAIALGHPIGASGARITTTLLHGLRRRGGERGLAAICHGTGGGTALSLELV